MKKLFMLSLAALVFASLPCMHNRLLRRLSSPNLLPR